MIALTGFYHIRHRPARARKEVVDGSHLLFKDPSHSAKNEIEIAGTVLHKDEQLFDTVPRSLTSFATKYRKALVRAVGEDEGCSPVEGVMSFAEPLWKSSKMQRIWKQVPTRLA